MWPIGVLFQIIFETELKDQVSFSDHILSLSVCLSVCELQTVIKLSSSFLKPLGQFQQTCYKDSWVKGIQIFTDKEKSIPPNDIMFFLL